MVLSTTDSYIINHFFELVSRKNIEIGLFWEGHQRALNLARFPELTIYLVRMRGFRGDSFASDFCKIDEQ
jgi:hypothetical protein